MSGINDKPDTPPAPDGHETDARLILPVGETGVGPLTGMSRWATSPSSPYVAKLATESVRVSVNENDKSRTGPKKINSRSPRHNPRRSAAQTDDPTPDGPYTMTERPDDATTRPFLNPRTFGDACFGSAEKSTVAAKAGPAKGPNRAKHK